MDADFDISKIYEKIEIHSQKIEDLQKTVLEQDIRINKIDNKISSYFRILNDVRSNIVILSREQQHLIKMIQSNTTETQTNMEIIKRHIIEEYDGQLKHGYRIDRLIKAIMFLGVTFVTLIFILSLLNPEILHFFRPLLSFFRM